MVMEKKMYVREPELNATKNEVKKKITNIQRKGRQRRWTERAQKEKKEPKTHTVYENISPYVFFFSRRIGWLARALSHRCTLLVVARSPYIQTLSFIPICHGIRRYAFRCALSLRHTLHVWISLSSTLHIYIPHVGQRTNGERWDKIKWREKKTEPEETTHNQRAHILVLALTSINAYISEEHQLHFSFMSPLFLPHWFVRPPLGLSLALAHQTFALMMPLLSSSSSFLMPHIYVAAIVLTLTRSHISLSSVCVYDVVDDYKEEKKRNKREKNYKTTQVESSNSSHQNSSLYHEEHQHQATTKNENEEILCAEKKLPTTNVWEHREATNNEPKSLREKKTHKLYKINEGKKNE